MTNNNSATLEAIIQEKKNNAMSVVKKIQNQQIADFLVPTSKLKFDIQVEDSVTAPKIKICLTKSCDTTLHKNAVSQLAEKLQIPTTYVKRLMMSNQWGSELLADNLNKLVKHTPSEKMLVRTTNNQSLAMAILSNNYKRIDSRPIVDAFMKVCTKLDLIPIDGYALDTKNTLRVISPKIYSPLGASNELERFVFGFEWSNSDFGCGANIGRRFKLRLVCKNGMVGTNLIKEIHFGGRLSDEVSYSQATLKLNTRASLSALIDTFRYYMSPIQMEKEVLQIQKANEKDLSDGQVKKCLSGLGKQDTEQIIRLYDSPDMINMPRGKTQYRLANAVSFFAQTDKFSRDKQLDLEELSGRLLEV